MIHLPLINFNSPIPNIGQGAFLLALLVSLLPSSNENILVQEVVQGNWLWDWFKPLQTDCPFTQWKNFIESEPGKGTLVIITLNF